MTNYLASIEAATKLITLIVIDYIPSLIFFLVCSFVIGTVLYGLMLLGGRIFRVGKGE